MGCRPLMVHTEGYLLLCCAVLCCGQRLWMCGPVFALARVLMHVKSAAGKHNFLY
jgi:hypothetical protein